MGRSGFSRTEWGLIGASALLVFSRVFGLSVVLANFRGHYEATLAVDAVWIGLAFGAYGLTMAVKQFSNGVLSDRLGRKPLLISASALFVAGSVWAAYAHTIETLIAARLVQGLGAVASVAMAAVGETVPAERRTTAMALVGIPAGGGFLAGIAVGPALYPFIGMTGLFLLAAGVGLAGGLAVLPLRFAPPETRPAGEGWGLRAPVVSLAVAGFAMNWFLTTTLFFLPDDDWRTLLPMLGVALVAVLVLSRPIDKVGWTWQPIAAALGGLAVAAPAFALAPDGWRLLVAGAAFFAFHSLLAMVLPSQVSRIAGPSGGRGHGVQNVVAYMGTFLAGPVAGWSAGAPGRAFTVAAGIAVVAAVLVTRHVRRPTPVRPGAAEAP